MGCHKNVEEDDILEPKLLLNVIQREMVCLLSVPWRRDAITELSALVKCKCWFLRIP